ncbi:MAG: dihydrodipicolinate synthase family protein [Geminicoccaceae bacterium]
MTRLTSSARGTFIIAATPFDETGHLDLAGIPRLMDFYLERGVAGITILGMMGEAPKLTSDEAHTFARHVLRHVDGRVPVVVGVSSPGFATMAELGRMAMDEGASALMIQPPVTAARGDDAVLTYLAQCVEAIGEDTPWILQDFPLASNVPMSAGLIRRIVEALPSCVMLKHEDWPGLEKLSAVRTLVGRRISILTGNGGIFLPFELMRGADGAMTGFAYPEMLVGVCAHHRAGRKEQMLDLFDLYLPLVRYEQQPGMGLAARKYVLMRRGALAHDFARAPAARLSETSRREIDWLCDRLEERLR